MPWPAGRPSRSPSRAGETLAGRFVQERHLLGLAAPLLELGTLRSRGGQGPGVARRDPVRCHRGDHPLRSAAAGGWPGRAIASGGARAVPGAALRHAGRRPRGRLERPVARLLGRANGRRRRLDDRPEAAPSGEAGAAPLQSITITGRAFVDAVDIRHANGDWEHIAFSGQTRSREPPRGRRGASLST